MAVAECPSCRVKIKVKDEILGRKAKCPKCATPFVVEDVSAAPVSERPQAPPPIPKPIIVDAPITARRPPKVEVAEDELDEVPPPRRGRDRDADEEEERPSRRRRRDEEDEDDDRPSRRRRDEEDDDDDADRGPRSRRDDDEDGYETERAGKRWSGTRTGLQMVFISTLVILGFVVITSIAAMYSPMPAMRDPQLGRPNAGGAVAGGLVQTMSGCVMMIAMIVGFVGTCMCCGAPHPVTRSRARVAVGCFAGGVILAIGVVLVGVVFAVGAGMQQAQNQQFNRPADPGLLGQLAGAGIIVILGLVVAGALFLCSFVFWILFHASIGEKFRDRSLRNHSFIYLGGFFGILLLQFLFGMMIGMMSANNPRLMIILLAITQTIFNIVIYGWYAYLCRQTIKTLS